jgi:hypothetical protein
MKNHVKVNISVEDELHRNLPICKYLELEEYLNQDSELKDRKVTNYVVGEKQYYLKTLVKQMKIGADVALGNNILIAEHDVLYPLDYFNTMINNLNNGLDVVIWENFCYLCYMGYVSTPLKGLFLSRHAFSKSCFLEYVTNRDQNTFELLEPSLCNINVVLSSLLNGDRVIENFKILNDPTLPDVLDFKHGFNSDGQISADKYLDFHPYWKYKEIYLNMVDQSYKNYIGGANKKYSYGLCSV